MASIIYKATGNLRAVQILLGHAKLAGAALRTMISDRDAEKAKLEAQLCAMSASMRAAESCRPRCFSKG